MPLKSLSDSYPLHVPKNLPKCSNCFQLTSLSTHLLPLLYPKPTYSRFYLSIYLHTHLHKLPFYFPFPASIDWYELTSPAHSCSQLTTLKSSRFLYILLNHSPDIFSCLTSLISILLFCHWHITLICFY